MSMRHRSEIPKPAPSERRVEHHRERQALRHALTVHDLDELVDPRVRHTLRAEHAHDEPTQGVRPRFRHWKAPFWKRRNAVRHGRNLLLAELAASEAASPEAALLLAE